MDICLVHLYYMPLHAAAALKKMNFAELKPTHETTDGVDSHATRLCWLLVGSSSRFASPGAGSDYTSLVLGV